MKPFHVGIAGRVALFAGLGLLGVITAERPVHAAGQAEPLLRSTPLVLKDGRIANVSIHEVPFPPGRADITPEARAGLIELTRAVGTDCFLTAQVIGHIGSSEVAEDDTLDAHRLARSRADAVQASLIERGLPAKAIASVWDWQFMVRQARATLWIFQLTTGEDCEGRLLRADMVAQAPRSTGQQAAPEAPRQAIVAAVAPAEATPPRKAANAQPQPTSPAPQQPAIAPTGMPDQAAPTPQEVEPKVAGSQPAREPEPVRTQAETRAGVASVTRSLPASDDKPAPATAPAKRATAAATRKAVNDAKIETDAEGALVITFATNSSYFPPGTSRRLNQLLSEIETGKRYEVSLQVAVSGTTKVVGAKSPQEAKRYNKWLAERRLERVQQWLLEQASPDTLSIRSEYLTADESRRVVVRMAPSSS